MSVDFRGLAGSSGGSPGRVKESSELRRGRPGDPGPESSRKNNAFSCVFFAQIRDRAAPGRPRSNSGPLWSIPGGEKSRPSGPESRSHPNCAGGAPGPLGPGQIAPKRASERDGKKKSRQNARVSAMRVPKRASERDFLKSHRQKRVKTREWTRFHRKTRFHRANRWVRTMDISCISCISCSAGNDARSGRPNPTSRAEEPG